MADNDNGGFFSNPTRRVGGNAGGATRRQGQNEAPVPRTGPTPSVAPGVADGERGDLPTRRVRPGGAGADTDPVPDGGSQPEFVVGWLVVVDGPGRGASRPLGYGVNPVGRDDTAGVQLDFGDQQISRCAHCRVVFDHKNRRFYIQHGGGQNLTYLGSEPVLSSDELPDRARIHLGDTTLLFVRLVDDQFDWEPAE